MSFESDSNVLIIRVRANYEHLLRQHRDNSQRAPAQAAARCPALMPSKALDGIGNLSSGLLS